MKILIITTSKPYKGSGTGLTEYAYQLSEHLRLMLSNGSSIDFLYSLSDSKRNNIKGLLYANTSFKKVIANVPKDKYDIIHITDHEIGFAAKIPKRKLHKKFVVGYIGALMKHKNVIFLLKAADILKSEPEYKFAIYGTGIDKNMLLRFKHDNGLDNVKLL